MRSSDTRRGGESTGRLRLAVVLCAAVAAPGTAYASCGASFCAINTDWDVQGQWAEPGVRFDLRYEYIDQDQPRAGTRNVGVGEIHRHHDEIRTLNRNYIATIDASFAGNWGVTVNVPYVNREHKHTHHHGGVAVPESWDFQELGDISVVLRRDMGQGHHWSWGLRGGVKLPTGDTDVSNAAGDEAERSLQPGTGTTGGVVGAYYRHQFTRASTFAQARYEWAFGKDGGYEPGAEWGVDLGVTYPLASKLAGMLQLNMKHKSRDTDPDPEHAADSGGDFVFISPGLSVQAMRNLQIYGFAQFPLYEDVNGVQLTADWAAVVGLSTRF